MVNSYKCAAVGGAPEANTKAQGIIHTLWVAEWIAVSLTSAFLEPARDRS
jgi:hypothetical protein